MEQINPVAQSHRHISKSHAKPKADLSALKYNHHMERLMIALFTAAVKRGS